MENRSRKPEWKESGRCWVEIDREALLRNVAIAAERLESGVEIMAVVKANAYGHGMELVVKTLRNRIRQFAVANLEEAVELSSWVEPDQITILSPALPPERAEIAGRGFIPMISTWEEACAYARHARVGKNVPVHLCVDTGMGRMGILEDQIVGMAEAVQNLSGIRIRSIASHLPCADEDDSYTLAQLERFHGLASELKQRFFPEAKVQVENSAGLLAFPRYAGDMVRAGLMIYGESPRPEFQARLEPILVWRTRVSLVRTLEAGHGISYGRTYLTSAPMRVATLSVGYADGYRRQMSGRGAVVLIGGKRCAVLGRITMDQIMVDVSGVPDVEPGAEAVLLGRQGEDAIWAREMARWADSIPWEIFTGLGMRVGRRLKSEVEGLAPIRQIGDPNGT